MVKRIKYTEKLANEICLEIATGIKSMEDLCAENLHWPRRRTICQWCFENEDFALKYARAKAFQTQWLVEEALKIAFDKSKDTYLDDKGNARCDHEWVQRSRLKVDTVKWLAGKLLPKTYGAKIDDPEQQSSFIQGILDKLS